MKIVVVSPHRDDAAFSLALSLGRWCAAGHKVTILNVFTRSLYAPYSDAESVHENDRLQWVSAMRKREDESFLRTLKGAAGGGGTMEEMNLKDAPIRLRCGSEDVCAMDVDPNDTATPKIRKALEKLVAKQDTALVLPLGLGHHVDHRVARDAALALSAGLPCAFYEDLPYATREGVRVDLSRFRDDASSQVHEVLHPVLCHGVHTQPVEWKRKTALLYSSQIDEAMARTIADFTRRYHGAERLWANDLWLERAGAAKLSTLQRDEEAEPLPA